MRSKYTAEQFVPVITRMQTYYTDGSAVSRDGRGRGQRGTPDQVAAAPQNPTWGREPFGIDAKTGAAKFFQVPTPKSSPRRGRMDAQDRFWFAEYTGDKVGMFDTRAETFQEWPMARKYTTPYAVSAPDRNGYVYATSNMSERLIRLDPRTGDTVEYQIPTEFDSKKLTYDVTGVTLWMVNTRTARLMKVEPLE